MTRTVAVTGASSGIGLAIVLRAVEAGFSAAAVVAEEPDAGQLQAEATRRSLDLAMIVVDLADAAAPSDFVTGIQAWALVNNAGYINAGQLQDVQLVIRR